MDLSMQLYSARNFQPWSTVLETLAEIGYKQVEGFGGVYDDPAAMRADLDRNGLTMPSGHFALDMFENDFATLEETARTLGMTLVACPHITADLRPADASGWRAFGERLAKAGKRANDAGFEFAWHNHDFEFAALPDGSVPQTHILEAAPGIGWEMDVAWIIRGGGDPMRWIEDYGPRIMSVHVKDIAKEGQGLDEDGWSDVGHGTVDWKALISRLKADTPAKLFIMEQDNPNDFRRFAKRSFDTVNGFQGAA